jgi:tyrosine-protein kinase Etk/Wzc
MVHKKEFQPSPLQEKESHLVDYLNVVLRRWKISLLLTLLVFFGVAVYTWLQTPIYSASATVTVHKETSDDVLQQQVLSGNATGLPKEIQLLTSRQMGVDVAKRLNLNWQYQSDDEDLQVQLQSLTIDPRHPRVTVEVAENNRLRIFDGSNKILGEIGNGELFEKSGVLIQAKVSDGSSGQRFALVQLQAAAAAERVQNGLTLGEVSKGSIILAITFEGPDPELAKNVANTTVQVYYERNIARKNAEANKMLDFVDSAINKKLEQEFGDYKSRRVEIAQRFRSHQ